MAWSGVRVRGRAALRGKAVIYLWDREDVAFESGTNKTGFVGSGQIVKGLTKEGVRPDPADG